VSLSPEAQRLERLISSTQSDALLSSSHEAMEARVLGEGLSLEGSIGALQDALRDLESEFDGVLERAAAAAGAGASSRPSSRK